MSPSNPPWWTPTILEVSRRNPNLAILGPNVLSRPPLWWSIAWGPNKGVEWKKLTKKTRTGPSLSCKWKPPMTRLLSMRMMTMKRRSSSTTRTRKMTLRVSSTKSKSTQITGETFTRRKQWLTGNLRWNLSSRASGRKRLSFMHHQYQSNQAHKNFVYSNKTTPQRKRMNSRDFLMMKRDRWTYQNQMILFIKLKRSRQFLFWRTTINSRTRYRKRPLKTVIRRRYKGLMGEERVILLFRSHKE